MKQALLTALCCVAALQLFAQAGKQISPSNLQSGQEVNLNINSWLAPKAPLGENPFGISAPLYLPQAVSPGVVVTMGDEGLPIYFNGSTTVLDPVTDERTAGVVALSYLESLQPAGIKDPAAEFGVKKTWTDERNGNYHVRLQQQYLGIPVFGAELIAHTTVPCWGMVPTLEIASVEPQIAATAAIEQVIEHIGSDKVKTNWRPGRT